LYKIKGKNDPKPAGLKEATCVKNDYAVKLKTVAEELELEVINRAPDYDAALIHTAEVNRPGLQLAGFYDYFDPTRIQIIGKAESSYLNGLSAQARCRSLEAFLSRGILALVICHGMRPTAEAVALSERYGVNLLRTDMDTSEFMARLILSLSNHLAPRETRHGVLVEVHGEGMLIMGESGIGKSETALELVKRGHRLIADDAVEIRRNSRDRLVGSAPELIRYYMEVRGIGVVDVRHLYGVGAVKQNTVIDLVVNFETWNTGKVYDRLGLETDTIDILGISLPYMTIPVRPGRNLAVILELAAMNHRQKKMGYNAAESLAAAHDRSVDEAAGL